METLMDEVKVQSNSGVTVAMTKYLNGERVDHGTTIKTTKLTKDEVDRLIRDFQTHDNKEAQETLVEVYTNLVEMLAKKYSKGKSFHEDLRQVGMIGLLGAIKRYDPEVGKSFEAFAIPTIIGEIKRFLRDKTWSVHVPRRIKELVAH